MDIKKGQYLSNHSIYIRLVYFMFFDDYFEFHLDFAKNASLFLIELFLTS